MCPTLPGVTHSQLSYTNVVVAGQLEFDTVASFVCEEGYFLVGDRTRTCIGNGLTTTGTWTGSDPTCEGLFYCPN